MVRSFVIQFYHSIGKATTVFSIVRELKKCVTVSSPITTESEMVTGIWVLGDQLWTGQAALSSCEKAKKQTPVVLIESPNYARARDSEGVALEVRDLGLLRVRPYLLL